jgi:hypothetical protein
MYGIEQKRKIEVGSKSVIVFSILLTIWNILMFVPMCTEENCAAEASRCDAEMVQQCIDGEWIDLIDCTALADWHCCAVDGGADCWEVCP